MRSIVLGCLLSASCVASPKESRNTPEAPEPVAVPENRAPAPEPDRPAATVADCFRYLPDQYDQHASDCYPTLEAACKAMTCPSVHTCAVTYDDVRARMLARPQDFPGNVVPARAPGQETGVLIDCRGW